MGNNRGGDAVTTAGRGTTIVTEEVVYQRYAAAAQERVESLCCAVQYSRELLEAIPNEILERDYGCGDPTPYAAPGDVVLDLGSGGGKLCYLLAQVVGPTGRVIGVDCNQEMLSLARRYQPTVAERLGFANVDFRYGMIQDLRLDLELLARELAQKPVRDPAGWLELRQIEERLRREQPMIPDGSIDCVVSNCVLNLVRPDDRRQLFAELHRVLREGGKAAISDIVADDDVPESLQQDSELWSGCVSGAFREDRFLAAFEEAGFGGIKLEKRESRPWRTVAGIEFRSVTVVAHKITQRVERDRLQAVIYRGPFKQVQDEAGRTFPRGVPIAVGDATCEQLRRGTYAGEFEIVEPREMPSVETAPRFDSRLARVRSPRETKGAEFQLTTLSNDSCCGADSKCC